LRHKTAERCLAFARLDCPRDPMLAEAGPEYLNQSWSGHRLQQPPELVSRQVPHLAQRGRGYQAILDLGRAGLRLHPSELDFDRHVERPAIRPQHVNADPAGQVRPDVPARREVNSCDANEPGLHPGHVVNDDAHENATSGSR